MLRFPYSFGRVIREIRSGLYLQHGGRMTETRCSSHRLKLPRHPIRSTSLLMRMLVCAVLTTVEEWKQLHHDQPYAQ